MKINKQKILAIGAILVIAALLVFFGKERVVIPETHVNTEAEDVESVVTKFGEKFHLVSLLADKATLNAAISGHYSPFVAPELIAKWQKDHTLAPGRAVSSPWPDRIEIDTTTKNTDGTYKVEGRVIEISSTEKTKDGIAAQYPVILTLKKDVRGKWMITAYEKL